jgi:hypothetical protein
MKRELENYIDTSLLTAAAPNYAGTGADFDDVPLLFAVALHSLAPGAQPWASVPDDRKERKVSAAKRRLNSELAQRMTPVLLTQVDQRDELRRWLRTVGVALHP